MIPRAEQIDIVKLNQILNQRPQLQTVYDEFNRLREIIFNREERWVLSELEEWIRHLSPIFKKELNATLIQFEQYKSSIAQHQEQPERVPDGLYRSLKELEKLIRQRRIFSSEVLRAMVLYSKPENALQPRGELLSDVIRHMMPPQNEAGGMNTYE